MQRLTLLFGAILLFLFSSSLADKSEPDQSCAEPPTIIQSVRLFDGADVVPAATVIIRCSRIDRVIESAEIAEIPEGAKLIDAKGMFLLPGLIDSHVHTFRRSMLERSLDFGVTTVLDMGSLAGEFNSAIDAEDAQAQANDRADMFGAVLWVTAPGSHGTQFGEVPTLDNAANAAEFVEARIEEGAEFIKIIYDNFKMIDRPVPTLSKETMSAVVGEAHRRGVMAVVHSRDLDAYADVVEAGIDGIVHEPVDAVPGQELLSAMKSTGTFVVPNLSLSRPEGARLIQDPVIGPMLTEQEIKNLENYRMMAREGGDLISYNSVTAFHEFGVTILAGSDSPNGGTIAGASLHTELELLVEAGLSPIEAMGAATSAPADKFGLDDRGRIAEGFLADLLLVEGRPDREIADTKKIVTVWKAGKAHSRAASAD
jgi:imidazolonepropionase-like amidohydrolase